MRFSDKSVQSIGRFYESKVAGFWQVLHESHMHVGYWDDANDDASLAEGSKKLTSMMIDRAEIREGGEFLDIGCGFGVPAILLSKQKGCRVTGITASAKQAEQAGVRAGDAGANAVFVVGDANRLPFPDRNFDGGWFFESIFHIGHENALKEASRVLRPGASLLITDFIFIDTPAEADRKLLSDVFHVNSLLTPESYPGVLRAGGFDAFSIEDVTECTIRKRKRKHMQAIESHEPELRAIFEDGEAYTEFVRMWLHMSDLMERHIGYVIVKAGKKR